MKRLTRKFCCCFSEDDDNLDDFDAESGSARPTPQYRLEASRKRKRKGVLKIFWAWICGSDTGGSAAAGINHNPRLAGSLHWMFRVNFIFLFAVMCIAFFGWVIVFSGFIIGAGKMDADCVQVGGISFGSTSSFFADAFALSWTTFSTVGYGSTYPALSHENENSTNCLFITVICSLESFIGVLYSGFCGAILFGKVLRIQSHAQVMFSDPIVIRYSDGVEMALASDDEEDEDLKLIQKIPCPVLEFRVVNRLFTEVGGEIMDGTLNVVANVDANDAADSEPSVRSTRSSTSSVNSSTSTGTDSSSLVESESTRRRKIFGGKMKTPVEKISKLVAKSHHTIDEDPSAKLVNKRIFSKMRIEASEHPFFKRVWVGRHILDDTSPIVKAKVRRQIRRNRGFWPIRLNTHEGVRDSLQFNQILVSLNGVSNVSASDVYAQKIYDFVDINVGYQFVNILYKDSDGSLKVDTDLLNDVREQKGGGGEPLILGTT